jgi:glycosyltransferase involved in cell wall biosynthesis
MQSLAPSTAPPRASRRTGAAPDGLLRVLHVGKFYPPHRGGMESHLHALCTELKEHVRVEVLVSSDDRRTTEEVFDGVRVTRAGTLLNLSAAPVCPEMVGRIRAAGADLVHIHLPHPTAVLAYLASGHRGRLVFTYHSDVVRQKTLARLFRPVLHRALARADAVVVASPNYVESSSVLRAFRDKCRVIPFGIHVGRFERPDPAEVAEIRRRYGPRIVLAVGRLIYYKGFEHLIRAMRGVRGHLLIVGSGPLRARLEGEARACGVGERVSFLGDVRDVAPFYHAADVFALPSVARSEAFGIVQLEAMACGRAVVNTDLASGVTFVSPGGVTGITVPPADPPALGRAVSALLDDPALRERYGRAGRLRVEREFSLDAMTARTLDLYRELS